MEEPPACQTNQPERAWPSLLKKDGGLLFVLLVLATVIRVWLLCHTEVTSRDSIGYERFAWELEHQDWKHVLRTNPHHPLYPLTILAMSAPVRQLVGGSDLAVMQLSAQLASGWAGILLVLPMFYLGKELFNRKVGFWAAALFQCLPVGARVLSDALSESLFLLTSATALLLVVRAFRAGSTGRFSLCGLFAGLSYLTRPEGILIVVAVAIVLVGRQARAGAKKTWTKTAKDLAGLLVASAVVASPYIATIQGFSNKTTTKDVLKTSEIRNPKSEIRNVASGSVFGFRISCFEFQVPGPFHGPPMAALVGIWWPDGKASDLSGHLRWGLYALASEISKGFFYVAWAPALIGLFYFRGRWRTWSGEAVLLVLCLLQCFALLRVAMVAGYVADRHVLIIVMCGLYWAVASAFWLTELVRAQKPLLRKFCPSATLLFLALAGVALPKTLTPLHANRAGHHAVGLWLAEHMTPADELDDPFCWAAHYAGRTFLPEQNASPSTGVERYRYIVHECRPDHRERFRKPSTAVGDLLAAGGRVVYHWPEQKPLEKAQIILFAVPLGWARAGVEQGRQLHTDSTPKVLPSECSRKS